MAGLVAVIALAIGLVVGEPYVPICRNVRKTCLRPVYGSAQSIECPEFAQPTALSTGAWSGSKEYVYFFDRPFADAVLRATAASDVLELGAGYGCYTTYWRTSNKLRSLRAVDGAINVAQITQGVVEYGDLTKPLPAKGTYDWTVIMEVAEHIPKQYEGVLFQNMLNHTRHGIIITWAPPGQAGVGHFNERPIVYVQAEMTKRGFILDSVSTEQLRRGASFTHFKRNALVFYRQQRLDSRADD